MSAHCKVRHLCSDPLFLISGHISKFIGHRYCESGDSMFIVCHMTSGDHVYRELYNFVGGNPSQQAMFNNCIYILQFHTLVNFSTTFRVTHNTNLRCIWDGKIYNELNFFDQVYKLINYENYNYHQKKFPIINRVE